MAVLLIAGVVVGLLYAPSGTSAPKVSSQQSAELKLTTKKRSYYKLDGSGKLVEDGNRHQGYYVVEEDEYTFERNLSPKSTAMVVIDPWKDSGSQYVNKHFEPIIRNKLIPAVTKAIELEIPVFILTNDPREINESYRSEIYQELKKWQPMALYAFYFTRTLILSVVMVKV